MLADSLDALRTFIKTTFPAVTRTYVSSVPDSFIRPSFFIDLATSSFDDLCKAFYEGRATWQIVYFAPMDAVGNPDRINQYVVADTIKGGLMDGMVLVGPSGTAYHILDCEGGPRDAEVYIQVRLESEFRRAETEYDMMQEIEHIQKMGSVEIE